MPNNYKKYPHIIRIISLILIITFIAQDMVWAFPDKLSAGDPTNNKLRPRQLFNIPADEASEALNPALVYFAVKSAIERSGIPTSSVSVEAIKTAIRKIEEAEWFSENVVYSAQEGEALLTFPSGSILRYYDPQAVSANKYSRRITADVPVFTDSIIRIQYLEEEVKSLSSSASSTTSSGMRIMPEAHKLSYLLAGLGYPEDRIPDITDKFSILFNELDFDALQEQANRAKNDTESLINFFQKLADKLERKKYLYPLYPPSLIRLLVSNPSLNADDIFDFLETAELPEGVNLADLEDWLLACTATHQIMYILLKLLLPDMDIHCITQTRHAFMVVFLDGGKALFSDFHYHAFREIDLDMYYERETGYLYLKKKYAASPKKIEAFKERFKAGERLTDVELLNAFYSPLQITDHRGLTHSIAHNRGLTYDEIGMHEEAARELEFAVNAYPGNGETHNDLAVIYRKLGKTADSIHHYKEAIRSNPRFMQAYLNLAHLFIKLHQFGEASDYLREAVKVDPRQARSFIRWISDKYGKDVLPLEALLQNDPKPAVSRQSASGRKEDEADFTGSKKEDSDKRNWRGILRHIVRFLKREPADAGGFSPDTEASNAEIRTIARLMKNEKSIIGLEGALGKDYRFFSREVAASLKGDGAFIDPDEMQDFLKNNVFVIKEMADLPDWMIDSFVRRGSLHVEGYARPGAKHDGMIVILYDLIANNINHIKHAEKRTSAVASLWALVLSEFFGLEYGMGRNKSDERAVEIAGIKRSDLENFRSPKVLDTSSGSIPRVLRLGDVMYMTSLKPIFFYSDTHGATHALKQVLRHLKGKGVIVDCGDLVDEDGAMPKSSGTLKVFFNAQGPEQESLFDGLKNGVEGLKGYLQQKKGADVQDIISRLAKGNTDDLWITREIFDGMPIDDIVSVYGRHGGSVFLDDVSLLERYRQAYPEIIFFDNMGVGVRHDIRYPVIDVNGKPFELNSKQGSVFPPGFDKAVIKDEETIKMLKNLFSFRSRGKKAVKLWFPGHCHPEKPLLLTEAEDGTWHVDILTDNRPVKIKNRSVILLPALRDAYKTAYLPGVDYRDGELVVWVDKVRIRPKKYISTYAKDVGLSYKKNFLTEDLEERVHKLIGQQSMFLEIFGKSKNRKERDQIKTTIMSCFVHAVLWDDIYDYLDDDLSKIDSLINDCAQKIARRDDGKIDLEVLTKDVSSVPNLSRRESTSGSQSDNAALLVGGEDNLRMLDRVREIIFAASSSTDRKSALYLASGADISTAVKATGAAHYVFVDRLPFYPDPGKPVLKEELELYLRMKMSSSFANGEGLEMAGALWPFLRMELRLIGAEEIKVSLSHTDKDVFFIDFKYQGVERHITFISNTDARDIEKYRQYISQGMDYYIIKSSEALYANPEGVTTKNGLELIDGIILNFVKKGGYILTDGPKPAEAVRNVLTPVKIPGMGEGDALREKTSFGYALSAGYDAMTILKKVADGPGNEGLIAISDLKDNLVWAEIKLCLENLGIEKNFRQRESAGNNLTAECVAWKDTAWPQLVKLPCLADIEIPYFHVPDKKAKGWNVRSHYWIEVRLRDNPTWYVLDRTIGQFADMAFIKAAGGLKGIRYMLNDLFIEKYNIKTDDDLLAKLEEYKTSNKGFYGPREDYPFKSEARHGAPDISYWREPLLSKDEFNKLADHFLHKGAEKLIKKGSDHNHGAAVLRFAYEFEQKGAMIHDFEHVERVPINDDDGTHRVTSVIADIDTEFMFDVDGIKAGRYLIEAKSGQADTNNILHRFFNPTRPWDAYQRYRAVFENCKKDGRRVYDGVILSVPKPSSKYPAGKITKVDGYDGFYVYTLRENIEDVLSNAIPAEGAQGPQPGRRASTSGQRNTVLMTETDITELYMARKKNPTTCDEALFLMKTAAALTGYSRIALPGSDIKSWFISQLKKEGVINLGRYIDTLFDEKGVVKPEERKGAEKLFNRIAAAMPKRLKPDNDLRTSLDRHHNALNYFKETVAPAVISEKLKRGDHSVTISIIGCSTGEEMASLYYYLSRAFENNPAWGPINTWQIRINGIDIAREAVREARKRLIKEPEGLASNYFSGGERGEILKLIKEMPSKTRKQIFSVTHGNIYYEPERQTFLAGSDVIVADYVLHHITTNSEEKIMQDLIKRPAWILTNHLEIFEVSGKERKGAERKESVPYAPLRSVYYVLAPPKNENTHLESDIHDITLSDESAVKELFDIPGYFLPTHIYYNSPLPREDYDRTLHMAHLIKAIKDRCVRLSPTVLAGLWQIAHTDSVMFNRYRNYARQILDAVSETGDADRMSPDRMAPGAMFWDWKNAEYVPWKEIIRNPHKQHKGPAYSNIFGTKKNQENYWANQIDVRNIFLESMRAIDNMDYETFSSFLLRMNKVLLTGPDGNRIYVTPASENSEAIKEEAGRFRITEEARQQKIKAFLRILQQYSKIGTLKEAIFQIADFYRVTITDHRLFLFFHGNNSLFMNMVNGLLRLQGLDGISHGDFDKDILLGKYGEDEFRLYFLQLVKKQNPRLNETAPCHVKERRGGDVSQQLTADKEVSKSPRRASASGAPQGEEPAGISPLDRIQIIRLEKGYPRFQEIVPSATKAITRIEKDIVYQKFVPPEINEALENPEVIVLLAVVPDRGAEVSLEEGIVGYLTAFPLNETDLYIERIGVEKHFEGIGIGRKMLTEIFVNGYDNFVLDTDSAALQAVYSNVAKALGYEFESKDLGEGLERMIIHKRKKIDVPQSSVDSAGKTSDDETEARRIAHRLAEKIERGESCDRQDLRDWAKVRILSRRLPLYLSPRLQELYNELSRAAGKLYFGEKKTWTDAYVWDQVLEKLRVKPGSILEVGPGFDPTLTLAAQAFGFTGRYSWLDKNNKVGEALERELAEKVGFNTEYVGTDIFEFVDTGNKKFDLVVLKHFFDDLFVGLHRDRHGKGTGKDWEEAAAADMEEDTGRILELTRRLPDLLSPKGLIIINEYPARPNYYAGHVNAENARRKLVARVVEKLRRDGRLKEIPIDLSTMEGPPVSLFPGSFCAFGKVEDSSESVRNKSGRASASGAYWNDRAGNSRNIRASTPRQSASGQASGAMLINSINDLFRESSIANASTILLSESLFGDTAELEEAKLALKPILDKGAIAILSPEEVRRRAINNKVTKDKMAIVLTNDDFNNREIWNGSDKEASLRSSVLILDDKLTGNNYLYLEGVVGLARAIMAKDRQAITAYYKLLAGVSVASEVLNLLDDGKDNNLAFALKAILRFKPVEIKDMEELRKYKVIVENFLIAA